jgi:hypothetical protein
VNCSGSGSAARDADGNITAGAGIPDLRPIVGGVFEGSIRTGTATFTVSGQLTRSTSPSASSSAEVSIFWTSAGTPQQGIDINANDFDPSLGAIPFTKTIQIVAPGSFDVGWSADLDCRGSSGSNGTLNVHGNAGVSVSYSLSN